jgi:hypothetical protein
MRSILICLFLLPFIAGAQVNRSSIRLAKENIQDYLENKVFHHQPYKPLIYGKLDSAKKSNPDIMWSMIHQFEITEKQMVDDKEVLIHKPYRFIFFLGSKMEILRADGAYLE